MFQFHFPYLIRTDDIVTVLNVLESVIQNIDMNVIFYVATCQVNNLWDNIRFREFVYYVFPCMGRESNHRTVFYFNRHALNN